MIVLFQTGKGTNMGAAFGGGSNQSLLGSTGATTFLTKATGIAALIFMLTSLTLAYLSGQQITGSVIKEMPALTEKSSASESESDTQTQGQPETSPE